jgi:hypothetical protein
MNEFRTEKRMTTRSEVVKAAVDRAVERYASEDTLRVAVQLLPVVGGAIDTILSGRGSRLQFARLERFIGQLHARLLHVEADSINVDSDEFVDFMVTCLEKASRARTPEKSQRFAEIVATQVSEVRPWDEADMATRLLADLEDIHMSILSAALAAPEGMNAFAGVKVVALKSHAGETLLDGLSAPLLNELGNQYSLISLRLACSELAARGLLHDEGVGRWDSTAMTYFVATDLATWLANWIHPTAGNLA